MKRWCRNQPGSDSPSASEIKRLYFEYTIPEMWISYLVSMQIRWILRIPRTLKIASEFSAVRLKRSKWLIVQKVWKNKKSKRREMDGDEEEQHQVTKEVIVVTVEKANNYYG